MEKIASHFLRRALITGMVLMVVALAHGQGTSSSKGGETILTSGDAAEVSGGGVKVIPMSKVPVKLSGAVDDKKASSGH